MSHRRAHASERTSLGIDIVAVALGVGFGLVDSINRRIHHHDDRWVGSMAGPADGFVGDARFTDPSPRYRRLPA
jgi:hypothetical protein